MEKNIHTKNNVAQNQSLEPSLLIGTIKKTISIIKSKELYNSLIMNKKNPLTSLETWVNLYQFMENYDLKEIYTIALKYTREPYLKSFQYKIINRILNTNEKLNKWSIKLSNKCNYFQAIDTIEPLSVIK